MQCGRFGFGVVPGGGRPYIYAASTPLDIVERDALTTTTWMSKVGCFSIVSICDCFVGCWSKRVDEKNSLPLGYNDMFIYENMIVITMICLYMNICQGRAPRSTFEVFCIAVADRLRCVNE